MYIDDGHAVGKKRIIFQSGGYGPVVVKVGFKGFAVKLKVNTQGVVVLAQQLVVTLLHERYCLADVVNSLIIPSNGIGAHTKQVIILYV